MPIPQTRRELTDLVESTYTKLEVDLDTAGPDVADLPCVDEWTVNDLLAVRAWWTEKILEWIESGRSGEQPITPAPGYKWKETPRLNADIVRTSASEPYEMIRSRLEAGFEEVLGTIRVLSDRELLEVGVFAWAGKWPISRWLSINTARQYSTARTLIRRALRESPM